MTETEARRLLRHGSTDTTRSGWATASIQVLSGGARAGAAIHTLTGAAAAVEPGGSDAGVAGATPDASAGGKPVDGLCSEHQGHCMLMSARGALCVSPAK